MIFLQTIPHILQSSEVLQNCMHAHNLVRFYRTANLVRLYRTACMLTI